MRKSNSVQSKMTGIIFLTSIFVMLIVSVQFVLFELKRIDDYARQDLNSLASLISANSSLPMALKDHVALQAIVDSLAVRKDIATAYLLSNSGRALVSYSSEKIDGKLSSANRIELLQLESDQINEGRLRGKEHVWNENGRLSYFKPVIYEGKRVGYSYLSIKTDTMFQQKMYLALGWFLSMGVAVLVTFLLSGRLQRQITRPVEDLASRMKKISREKRLVSRDDNDNEEDNESDDEFSLLVKGFDEMIKALKERDQLLEKHRRDLEVEVQVRTRALEAEKEKAEQATLAKSKFLANMSHEIRTPMIGVLGMADLLRKRNMEPGDQQLVETIYRSGEALLTILNDILDFSKIEAGRLEFDVTEVDLEKVTQDVVGLMRINAGEKGLELTCDLPESCPVVCGDPGRIRQVLLNLIGNAIKFTDEGDVQVSLTTSTGNSTNVCHVVFVIRDTGIGIPDDEQKDIFKSFIQGGVGRERILGGTGLGLSIVNQLVRTMGGAVKLDSEVDRGSTFTVNLPLPLAADVPVQKETEVTSVAEQAPAETIPPDRLNESSGNFRVLLAEDNPTTQNLIAILLEQMGIELTVVDNGLDAVEFLENNQVELILMDCQMPKLDGLKATAMLRGNGLTTPVIALTAYARAEDEEECLAAGMSDFLSKPFRQAEMYSMLDKWLPRKENEPHLSTSQTVV